MMPVLFVGHGSPMNAIEENEFTKKWKEIGESLSPKGILMLSAHWFTRETYYQWEDNPRKINDMYGFPKALYDLPYPVKGDQDLSEKLSQLLRGYARVNNEWGIDHGAWSVLVHMFPKADIPLVQVSIKAGASPLEHYQLGEKLSPLLEEDYLIIGSGNIVHNLHRMTNQDGPLTFTKDFDRGIKEAILTKDYDQVLAYSKLPGAREAVPTTDHLDPLFYVLGAAGKKRKVEIFNEASVYGSLTMTSYLFTD